MSLYTENALTIDHILAV